MTEPTQGRGTQLGDQSLGATRNPWGRPLGGCRFLCRSEDTHVERGLAEAQRPSIVEGPYKGSLAQSQLIKGEKIT